MQCLSNIKNVRIIQYLAAILASLAMASIGNHTAWTSPTLPLLMSDNSPIGIKITSEQASWIVSLVYLTSIPGSVLTGFLTEKFGPKWSLLISGVGLILPWILIIFAKSFIHLYVARAIAGISIAVVSSAISIYIGEIADKDIRGTMGSMIVIMLLLGNCFIYTIGPFVSYVTLAVLCAALPVVFLGFYLMPESPYYLVKLGKRSEAKKNLAKLCKSSSDDAFVENALQEIEKTVDKDMKNKSTVKELFSNKEYTKPIIILTGLKSLQQLNGILPIMSYTQTILETSGSAISPEISSMVIGAVQIPAAIACGYLSDKLGRKPLLVISALGCAVSLANVGVYFYMKNIGKDISMLYWLPTTALVVFMIMCPLGILSLPYVLAAEIFPTNIKGIALSTINVYSGILAFLTTKLYQTVVTAWGIHFTFWIFAAFCVLGTVFIIFVVPETKGKSFADIQEKINNHLQEGAKTHGRVSDDISNM